MVKLRNKRNEGEGGGKRNWTPLGAGQRQKKGGGIGRMSSVTQQFARGSSSNIE